MKNKSIFKKIKAFSKKLNAIKDKGLGERAVKTRLVIASMESGLKSIVGLQDELKKLKQTLKFKNKELKAQVRSLKKSGKSIKKAKKIDKKAARVVHRLPIVEKTAETNKSAVTRTSQASKAPRVPRVPRVPRIRVAKTTAKQKTTNSQMLKEPVTGTRTRVARTTTRTNAQVKPRGVKARPKLNEEPKKESVLEQ